MIPSDNLLKFTAGWEGCLLHAYKDSGGIWTIGIGHTGIEIKEGMIISSDRALELLRSDMSSVVKFLNDWTTVNHIVLNQNQFDALCDLVFNIGAGRFKSKQISTYIMHDQFDDDIQGIWEQTCTHDAAGNELKGLINRRKAEYELYSKVD